jgi:hypothetical protein
MPDFDEGGGTLAKLPDYYCYRDGDGGQVMVAFDGATELDPEHWDDGSGKLQQVPDGQWQIVLVCDMGNHFRIVYGQELFGSPEEAERAAIGYRPDVQGDITWPRVASVHALKQGATDLSDFGFCKRLCRQCAQDEMGPSHNGSARCESHSIASGGHRSHCTCDVCF